MIGQLNPKQRSSYSSAAINKSQDILLPLHCVGAPLSRTVLIRVSLALSIRSRQNFRSQQESQRPSPFAFRLTSTLPSLPPARSLKRCRTTQLPEPLREQAPTRKSRLGRRPRRRRDRTPNTTLILHTCNKKTDLDRTRVRRSPPSRADRPLRRKRPRLRICRQIPSPEKSIPRSIFRFSRRGETFLCISNGT